MRNSRATNGNCNKFRDIKNRMAKLKKASGNLRKRNILLGIASYDILPFNEHKMIYFVWYVFLFFCFVFLKTVKCSSKENPWTRTCAFALNIESFSIDF